MIGSYAFTKLIGDGGFAEVYLVRHVDFGTEFVAKVMTFDQSEKEEKWEVFESEVNALITLNHPHIIRMYDYFQSGSQLHLILEYCRGGSVSDEINQTAGMNLPRFLEVSAELAKAFAYCHRNNIAHRDIKPANVLLDEFARPKIADFGLAIVTTAGQKHRQFGGSVAFTAPEITQKKPHDPMAGDVWALGVMFTMMITGSSPWQCESLGTMKTMAAQGVIQFKKDIPPDVEALIRQMIVVDPMQRLTMAEVEASSIFVPVIPRPLTLRKSLQVRGWQQIAHRSSDAFELVDPDEEDKLSNVYAAASAIRHVPPSLGVPQRLHRRSAEVKPTFGDFAAAGEILKAGALSKRPSRWHTLVQEPDELPEPRPSYRTGRGFARPAV
jgi:serine/threonine protein kinase